MGVSEGTFWESIGPGRREGGRAGVKAGEAGGGHSRFVDVDIRRRSVDPEFLVVIHGVYRAVRAAPVLPNLARASPAAVISFIAPRSPLSTFW